MVSQQLFEQWRVRLAEWQQRLDQGRPRPWLARAYVRVLSFLLKQYVPCESTPEPLAAHANDDRLDRNRSAMRFLAATPDIAGKPPRSRDDIRSVLEAVKAKAPRVEPGPLTSGLGTADPIVMASFYHPGLAAGVRQDLQAAGIAAELKSFRRQTQVIVRAGDLERASAMVATHPAFRRDSSRSRVQYAALFASVGATLGVLLGTITAVTVTAAMSDPPMLLLSAFALSGLFGLPFALVGLVVGTIVDG